MKYIIFLLSIVYMHILDDFYLQGVLSNMKRRIFWLKDKDYKELYRYDYIISLLIHALSWTISINIPIMFILYQFNKLHDIRYTIIFIVEFILNWIIHSIVDNLKANKMKINLIIDQVIHFIQVFIVFLLFVNILY